LDRFETYIEQGRQFTAQRQFAQAERMLQAARRLSEAIGDADRAHAAVAELGNLFAAMGKVDEAVEAYNRVVLHYTRRLAQPGLGDREGLALADQLWRIGAWFIELGLLDAADAAIQHGLAGFQAFIDPDGLEAARCLSDLGRIAEARGELLDAEGMYGDAVMILRAIAPQLPPEDLTLAWALQGLGTMQLRLYRLEDAQAALLESYATLQGALGADSPELGWVLDALAQVFEALGHPDRAENFCKRALAVVMQVPGQEAVAAQRLTRLAQLYAGQGRHVTAENAFATALQRMREAVGDEHPAVGEIQQLMADMYWDMGELDRAVYAAGEALRILHDTRGPQDPEVAALMNMLASLHVERGDPASAEPLARRSYEIFAELMPGQHATATALNLLGQVARGLGRLGEAEQHLRDSINIMVQAAGEADERVITSVNNLAGVCAEQGHLDKAEGMLRWALGAAAPVLGLAHPQVALALDTLVGVLQTLGRPEEADALLHWAEQAR
jgi:tetratricopeptide (TPR) repeat protein